MMTAKEKAQEIKDSLPAPPKDSAVMKELRRIQQAIGGGAVSASRQAKKGIMKQYGLSGRQWKKVRKNTKRRFKAVLALREAQKAIDSQPETADAHSPA